MEHKHNVIDRDTRFIIDPVTRLMKTTSKKKSLVQYDHNSEIFTFEIPRFGADGHDMSLCDRVEVHYINIDKKDKTKFNEDIDLPKDLRIDEDDPEKVIFSWKISVNATQYEGLLSFLVRYLCTDGEEITYSWNTALYKGISVLEGMDNTKAVIEEYSDVLNAWKDEVLAGFAELSTGFVRYDEPQELTEEEKQQARENIGLEGSITEMLLAYDILPVIKDADGAILLDADGAMLFH